MQTSQTNIIKARVFHLTEKLSQQRAIFGVESCQKKSRLKRNFNRLKNLS
jgi:hypothetical protein